jgi:putative membrane protein
MKTPDQALAKKLNIAAWIVTAVVLALVGLMRRVKIPIPDHWDFSFLPPFHAAVNALTAVTLLTAFYFIRQKNIEAHRKAIFVALGLSVLFLLSYVTYHFTTPETIYGDVDGNGKLDAGELSAVGMYRTIYLVILLSHIVLAAFSLPLILFTFIRAFTHQFDLHKKMARWVFPIWLYVAITGPVCYWMLKPFYP